MRLFFVITLALFLSSLHCFANADYNALWQKGNVLYQEKQYDSAAFYYEEIASLKPLNAEIYYNLGNTYYRLNKIGLSVLNYEHALKINPDYKEAKENLSLAQSRISNNIHPVGDIFFIRWWHDITAPKYATAMAITAAIIFILYICLLTARRFRKVNIPIQIQALMLFVCLCFLSLSFVSTRNAVLSTGAVVMQGDAPLMSRELKGKPLALLPEGTIIKVEQEQGDWVQVMLPDGREGWLRQDLIARI